MDKQKIKHMIVVAFIALLFNTGAIAAEASGGEQIDQWFGALNGHLATVLFFDMWPGEGELPFIVGWLIVGAVFLTIRMGFVNLRVMGHAYRVIRGKYNRPGDMGEVTSFQALTTALSATVGLGNIAGVAIAVSVGGPGATFWMIVAGFLGMTSKFTEVTLAQTYREVRPDGRVMGGAMEYLSEGLAEKGWPRVGMLLAMLFALLTIGASLGGGNAFQVSQAMAAVQQEVVFFADNPWVFGVTMAFLVGIVILGGIRRIAQTAEAIVPLMVLIYLAAALWVIISYVSELPAAFTLIFQSRFFNGSGYWWADWYPGGKVSSEPHFPARQALVQRQSLIQLRKRLIRYARVWWHCTSHLLIPSLSAQ